MSFSLHHHLKMLIFVLVSVPSEGNGVSGVALGASPPIIFSGIEAYHMPSSLTLRPTTCLVDAVHSVT
jgi:hypothetical protein